MVAGARCLRAIGQRAAAGPQHTLAPDRDLAAQVRVPAGTGRIDALTAPLQGVDLTGVVVTADASPPGPTLRARGP